MFNDWIVQEYPPFGAWEWTISPERLDWRVIEAFWAIGMETGIWGLGKVWGDVEGYLADAKICFEETKILHFVSSSELAKKRGKSEYWRGNRLTFYDEYGENLKTAWVADAGELLRNLYPKVAAQDTSDMDLYSALRLWGAPLNVQKNRRDEYTFGAKLHANIWFPELPRKPHWSLPEGSERFTRASTIDNSILAFENARRLNTFLREMQALMRDVCGTTTFIRPAQKFYRPFIDIDGIKI